MVPAVGGPWEGGPAGRRGGGVSGGGGVGKPPITLQSIPAPWQCIFLGPVPLADVLARFAQIGHLPPAIALAPLGHLAEMKGEKARELMGMLRLLEAHRRHVPASVATRRAVDSLRSQLLWKLYQNHTTVANSILNTATNP